MRLHDVDEVLAVRREVDGVVERRVGEPPIVLAVEPDAVQLQLHVVVAVARHVVERLACFIDPHDRAHLERVIRQRREQLAAEVVEVEVPEAGALGRPR